MDACHILLGRPWQFDRKIQHDRFKNTYTFKKDGRIITVGPSNLRKEGKSNMLFKSEFQEEAVNLELFVVVFMEQNLDSLEISI